jgi:AcrR family transcriptional regulator
MVATRGPEPAEAPKRRLPIQIANEAKMIQATIELLGDHQVDEITSRMIARDSGTATNYISRYFGGRDGLFVAVAAELGRRISGLVRSDQSVLEIDRPGNFMYRIMAIPEVDMWFKVFRYLSSRNLTGIRPHAKPALVSAIEDSIGLIFGLEGEYVPICANIFLTYLMGNAAFGSLLGTTDDQAEDALTAMGTFAEMLVAQAHEQEQARGRAPA